MHDTDDLPLSAAVGTLALACAAIIYRDIAAARAVPVLKPDLSLMGVADVSVLIPARNEVARLPRLLDALAGQLTRPRAVIVVDDASDDGTAAVAGSYQGWIPELEVISGAPLPDGWSGKCWACWQAAAQATSTWLLFLDADTAPAPPLLGTLLAYAEAHQIDLLSALPRLELKSWSERLLLPPFVGIASAAFPLDAVNDPRSSVALANGQCLLIKRTVYVATGGHAAVRASILEDTELGQLVKSHGYKLRIVAAPELIKVRMYTGLAGIVEGLGKNAAAGFNAGGWRSAVAGLSRAILAFGPLLAVCAGGLLRARGNDHDARVMHAAAVVYGATMAYLGLWLRRVHRLNPLWALTYPFGTLAYFTLAAGAWFRLRFGRGVSWKGRRYGSR